jgi:hypothetical protein
MMKYKYNGTDERVFPSIGVTVKPGDEFDAPEGFVAANVTLAGAKPSVTEPTEPKETTTTMSAASDKKLGA